MAGPTCDLCCHGNEQGKIPSYHGNINRVIGAWLQVKTNFWSLLVCGKVEGHFMKELLLIPALALHMKL